MRVEFTIPPRTLENKPASMTAYFLQGQVISRERIVIPEGHKGLAYFQIRVGLSPFPVLPDPSSTVKWIRGDNDHLDYNIRIQLDPPQYTVTFVGYNTDSKLEHTFIIDLN